MAKLIDLDNSDPRPANETWLQIGPSPRQMFDILMLVGFVLLLIVLSPLLLLGWIIEAIDVDW